MKRTGMVFGLLAAVALVPVPSDAGAGEAYAQCASSYAGGYRTGGFCAGVFSFHYAGGISTPIGRIRFGSGISVDCKICECWYVYQGSSGSRLKRTTNGSCSGGFEDLELYGPTKT